MTSSDVAYLFSGNMFNLFDSKRNVLAKASCDNNGNVVFSGFDTSDSNLSVALDTGINFNGQQGDNLLTLGAYLTPGQSILSNSNNCFLKFGTDYSLNLFQGAGPDDPNAESLWYSSSLPSQYGSNVILYMNNVGVLSVATVGQLPESPIMPLYFQWASSANCNSQEAYYLAVDDDFTLRINEGAGPDDKGSLIWAANMPIYVKAGSTTSSSVELTWDEWPLMCTSMIAFIGYPGGSGFNSAAQVNVGSNEKSILLTNLNAGSTYAAYLVVNFSDPTGMTQGQKSQTITFTTESSQTDNNGDYSGG